MIWFGHESYLFIPVRELDAERQMLLHFARPSVISATPSGSSYQKEVERWPLLDSAGTYTATSHGLPYPRKDLRMSKEPGAKSLKNSVNLWDLQKPSCSGHLSVRC